MKEYLLYAGMVVGIPVFYWLLIEWQKPHFELEENRSKKVFKSVVEIILILISEATLIRLIYEYKNEWITELTFALLYMVLVIMTVLHMTDLWEKIVPNRILLAMILAGTIIIGFFFVKDINQVISKLSSFILGFLFCFITFGLAYMVSKGSLGSGDVKLAFLLGIFLTGDYIVGTIFYGCLAGSFYSIVQLWRKKIKRTDELPFVPFLYMGLIITYFMR